tara:strand:- start:800 stop:4861 length:4062 start_codon:yes stop_codon:yes gene_type:complete
MAAAQYQINTGTPDGNNGDLVRDAFVKTQDNFTSLFNSQPPTLYRPNAAIDFSINHMIGFKYYVQLHKFIIDGEDYELSAGGTLTLSAADATLSRIDVIVGRLNTTDPANPTVSIEVIEGVLSSQPVEPAINLLTEVKLSVKLILANQTTDGKSTSNMFYDENIEWTNTSLPTGANLDYITGPFNGIKNIYLPAISTTPEILSWSNASMVPLPVSNGKFVFAIKSAANRGVDTTISIKLTNSVSTDYHIRSFSLDNDLSNFGYTFSGATVWDVISIPMEEIPGSKTNLTEFDQVSLTISNSSELAIDWIHIEDGVEEVDPAKDIIPAGLEGVVETGSQDDQNIIVKLGGEDYPVIIDQDKGQLIAGENDVVTYDTSFKAYAGDVTVDPEESYGALYHAGVRFREFDSGSYFVRGEYTKDGFAFADSVDPSLRIDVVPSALTTDITVTLPTGAGKLALTSEIPSIVAGTGIAVNYVGTAATISSTGGGGGSGGTELIDEGNGNGLVITGRTAANYGNVGALAVDLSYSADPSTTAGATGEYSTIAGGYDNTASAVYGVVGGGYGNTASGDYGTLVAGGANNTASAYYAVISGGTSNSASGQYSIVAGGNTNSASGQYGVVGGGAENQASGDYSTVTGRWNIAPSYGETSSGVYSTTYTAADALDLDPTDRLFNLGNGLNNNNRSDAFTILKAGEVLAPSLTTSMIDSAANSVLTTKEWVTANGGGGTKITNEGSGNGLGYSYRGPGQGLGTIGAGAVCFTNRSIPMMGSLPDTAGATGTASVVTGGKDNTASSTYSTISGGFNNTASAVNSTVGGGLNNQATASRATIAGGDDNTASGVLSAIGGGEENIASGAGATVGGGYTNSASGQYSTISGGYGNVASAEEAFIGGGEKNTASAIYSVAVGGYENTSSAYASFVGGGIYNTASAEYSIVLGGDTNTASGNFSMASGKRNEAFSYAETAFGVYSTDYVPVSTTAHNVADKIFNIGNGVSAAAKSDALTVLKGGEVLAPSATTALIDAAADSVLTTKEWVVANSGGGGGGTALLDEGNGDGLVVSGRTAANYGNVGLNAVDLGYSSAASTTIGATANYTTVGGGYNNTASTYNATVSGGYTNTASGGNATIGGGYGNTGSGYYSTISGGGSNSVSGYQSTIGGGYTNNIDVDSQQSTIGGGTGNAITGFRYSTIGGGRTNSVTALNGTVGGGFDNDATSVYASIGGGQGNVTSGGTGSVGHMTISGGKSNTASGVYSTVTGGLSNTASGLYATAGGQGNTAGDGETVFGQYATAGTARAFAIGAGTVGTPSNVLEVYKSGGIVFNPSSQPGETIAGMMYYDSTSNVFKFYNGTAWLQIQTVV